jgi:thiamine-phosphate diphosphorylase
VAAHLPALLVLTDRRIAAEAGHSLPALVSTLAGLDVAVVLREKDLPYAARAALGREVASAAADAGVPLIVASSVELALELGAAGVHLAASDAPASCGLVGRSCHDERELARAAAEGADYATVSPVFPTSTKPGYGPALGVDGLSRLARGAGLPVYALGGIGPGRVAACVEAGAHGVALLGAAMTPRDPAAQLALILDELRGSRPQ